MKTKVRIGIDVGGTFTDAVLIDNATGLIIAKEKTPTTHYSDNGVAQGIVDLIDKIMKNNNVSAEDVVFIAHGTTQATNALLEGDVAKVGIVGIVGSKLAQKEVTTGQIELAEQKYLETETEIINPNEFNEEKARAAIKRLMEKGCEVIVASQEYSIDNPENEDKVVELCNELGVYSTAGHLISELYGLRTRTRTAVVNASLIPKMLETANMTENVVKELGIGTELMIMRADGGVMSVSEVRNRPILTMLSGLAAGVAGALIHEKITDGIFMEVGGTSIDISLIKDGKVIVNNASVGSHKTYLKALDVRTLAIAGGSMMRISDNKITDVGPRSAHLAGKDYENFADPAIMKGITVKKISPLEGDSEDYAILSTSSGQEYAYTLAGAANILGFIPEGDYAYAPIESSKKAWEALAKHLKRDVQDLAQEAMDIATEKIYKIIDALVQEYEVDKNFLELVGGGGSASVTTFALGKRYNMEAKIAKNAPYISTIGVALALVREQIERSVVDPSVEDIKQIRIDVTNKILAAGAKKQTIHIDVEVDSQKNIIRAIASGATDFSEQVESNNDITIDDMVEKLANGFDAEKENIKNVDKNAGFNIFEISTRQKKFFGLIKQKKKYLSVINNEGIILNRLNNGAYTLTTKANLLSDVKEIIEENSSYSDAGQTVPRVYVFSSHQYFDYSGLINEEQITSVLNLDLEYFENDETIIITAEKK